ncbi:MAG: biotin transporter BioY [Hoeflea sp.]|uniref:biotin transporter BioY n=1 Tax=Hoeflea sp. TaxID=1940281 RepID=UPI0027307A6E|nr:biotin transporter BioY [Hoeflea sp.]MDP2118539.1 biotin transporter BioY [Hoeflea sp.]
MATAPALSFVETFAPESKAARYATYGALVLSGSLLIALAGKITVPFWPVPATLQTLAIFIIAAAFGRKLALATLAAYMVEGAMGFPVFTGGGGLAYFAGPTGGYLAGFVIAAGLTGWAADRGLDRNAFKLFAVNLAGTAIILALGAAWIALAFGPEKALAWGVGPFIATDVIKAALAAAVVPAGWQIASMFRR